MPSSGSERLESAVLARKAWWLRLSSALAWLGWLLAIVAAFWANAIVGLSAATLWAVGATLAVWAIIAIFLVIAASVADDLSVKHKRYEARQRFIGLRARETE